MGVASLDYFSARTTIATKTGTSLFTSFSRFLHTQSHICILTITHIGAYYFTCIPITMQWCRRNSNLKPFAQEISYWSIN